MGSVPTYIPPAVKARPLLPTVPGPGQTLLRDETDLLAHVQNGSVIRTLDGRMLLVRLDFCMSSDPSKPVVLFIRLVVKSRKRGHQIPQGHHMEWDIYPALLLYTPKEARQYSELPTYYLENGFPNPDQFVTDHVLRPGFERIPTRRLRRGTVVELLIGGYALLPYGYTPEKSWRQPVMRVVKKDRSLAKQARSRNHSWYGGLRVVWEPERDLEQAEMGVSFTEEGILRAYIEEQFNQKHGWEHPPLAVGAL